MLHEWFGLQPSFRLLADSLRREGFTVLVPDFYDGRVASDVGEAEVLMREVDRDQERVDLMLAAAAAHLTENWHPRLGLIGLSMGAWWAARLAQLLPVDATVLFYGRGDIDPSRWDVPLQVHLAERDDLEPLAEARSFFEDVAAAGIETDLHVYAGVGHGFANASVPAVFSADAAELAITRTASFLHHHLA